MLDLVKYTYKLVFYTHRRAAYLVYSERIRWEESIQIYIKLITFLQDPLPEATPLASSFKEVVWFSLLLEGCCSLPLVVMGSKSLGWLEPDPSSTIGLQMSMMSSKLGTKTFPSVSNPAFSAVTARTWRRGCMTRSAKKTYNTYFIFQYFRF